MGGDLAGLNAQMVGQLAKAGHIRSFAVEEAFRNVMRHLFVPTVSVDLAYSGEAVVTRRGPDGLPISSSSMPGIMAVMLEQLDVNPAHRVLEIGTGTGYNAALLAYLAGETGRITTVDIDEDIVQEARHNLDRAGFFYVRTLVRDGWLGVAENAPYNRLEVTVGVWDLSPYWVDHLVDGGIMVVPLWLRAGAQASIAFQKNLDRLRSVSVEPCGFMRLRGPNAGPEAYVPLDDWNVSMDKVDTTRISILKELLRANPREEPAPKIPARWFVLLALDEPRVIQFESNEDWTRTGFGIFDHEHNSLSLIFEGKLRTYGEDAARVTLIDRLTRAQPFDFHRLMVEAVPIAQTIKETSGWVLERPNFRFTITQA